MTRYSVISVDWKSSQTKLWQYHLEKNCPDIEIVTIRDEKPVPWNWASGKVNCFKQPLTNDRVIYMDTDTIVTRDLEFIFDEMGSLPIGLSSLVPIRKFNEDSRTKATFKKWGFTLPLPTHYHSGIIVWKMPKAEMPTFREDWLKWYKDLKPAIEGHHYANEITLSFLATAFGNSIWDIPLEVQGNICGKKHFGTSDLPATIHFHKSKRLEQHGLGRFLETENV